MNTEPKTSRAERRTNPARRSLLGALAVGLVLSAVAQTNTNTATNSAANAGAWPTFDTFNILQRRNIFDPNRFPYRETQIRPTGPRVEGFALKGTMSYAKGRFAFFDGTEDQYNKVLEVGGNIAGYTVKEITTDSVTLEASGKEFKMPVGRQVRKYNGTWQMGRPVETTSDDTNGDQTEAAADSSAPPAAANAQMSDILKRLMEAKKQELEQIK